MSWKDANQKSLAESMFVKHDALLEMYGVHALVDWRLDVSDYRSVTTAYLS